MIRVYWVDANTTKEEVHSLQKLEILKKVNGRLPVREDEVTDTNDLRTVEYMWDLQKFQ